MVITLNLQENKIRKIEREKQAKKKKKEKFKKKIFSEKLKINFL